MSHRFSHLETAPPDAILGLSEAFGADSNPNKLNLSVGVYKDETGKTPILEVVKAAEKKILEEEATKGYLPIEGSPEYAEDVRKLVFGDAVAQDRTVVVQTPGGTGGLRVAADFMRTQLPQVKVWMPNPTWANHPAIFMSSGVPTETYRYLADDRTSLDLDGMLQTLRESASAGDVILLHGCCHNPTGIDPSGDDWKQIAQVVEEKKLLPLIDFAYQGFGDGIEQDAVGLRTILQHTDEALVCSSFSKNFGLYSERVGAICLVAADAENATAARSQLKRTVRTNYSNPPRHGASIVATILGDPQLTAQWKEELESMRQRITRLREQFVQTMKSTGSGHDFGFLLRQRGMFSYSGLTPMQVDELKSKYGIYIVGSGRINVAGMSESKMQYFCDSVASVLS
ncbi:amino acid aminotransferase [Roseiconus lacunae]|uniref:Amino acid aminotransferase n=1 Tax=Roseiconus lacunae TaxID=2605694 RepID=A0ABT7PBF7_9BACT|nr:amino acid aminotransferase [Roseiconus lacunae]MCD0459288.1 aspartate/tyrosine/aromatic aminotransferase [Roseiconus lacunae]MDM4013824.1 amino acid aminotransferase [Roseiconus lacunae]